jgi:CYTH domain-containing protein
MQEIERKFIVRSLLFPLDNYSFEDIRQGYLVTCRDGNEARVRQKGDHYFLTIKKGAGLERQETEIAISQAQFEKLYQATADERLEKRRYVIQDENDVIEVDIFGGKLEGLMLAEVEFKTVNDSKTYKVPSWFDREVTDDQRFANRNLAKYGLPSSDYEARK